MGTCNDQTVTRAQREQYEEDGYYIARGLLEPDQVALLSREIKDIIASGTDGINFDNTRMDGKTLKGSGTYRKLALLGRRNPLVWDTYYTHPGIIAINRAFLGGEVKLWFDSIFTKPARGRGHALAPGHRPVDPDPTSEGEQVPLPGCAGYLDGQRPGRPQQRLSTGRARQSQGAVGGARAVFGQYSC